MAPVGVLMFPGMGGRGLNPKQLNQMMKQLGIQVEDVDDVEEVIIRTAEKDIVIREASVTIMTAQGTQTFQIVGNATEVPRAGGAASASGAASSDSAPAPAAASSAKFTEEDVRLVADQARVSLEKARAALEAADGEPAEAILKLTE